MEVLDEFMKKCEEKFRDNLVSIVLFGSYAIGTAKETSDIDVLVIAKDLPANTWERDELLDDITDEIFFEYGEDIQPILATPRELKMHAEWPNPIFYGILFGYEVLYGSEFFDRIIKIVKERVREKRPVFIKGDKEWEIAKMI